MNIAVDNEFHTSNPTESKNLLNYQHNNQFLNLLFLTLLAVAFAPVARSSRASLKMSYENEIGALPPTGFWDPLGLSKDIDAATFRNYREAELKHGRVAQLAVIGYLAQENFRLPGAIDLDGTVTSLLLTYSLALTYLLTSRYYIRINP